MSASADDWEDLTPDPPTTTFVAAYHGRCNCCGDDITPGDSVGYLDDEVVCEDCLIR